MPVLVIEDNPVNLKILELNLQKHGYQTICATRGSDALNILSENSEIELVITDIMMPDIDGLEVLRQIKQDHSLKHIPVIICTAMKDIETVRKAVELGCRHYIVKPVIASQLIQKVREALFQDRVILQNRVEVLSRLNLNLESYHQLARTFSSSVDDVIRLLEDVVDRDRNDDLGENLNQLMESAQLLGADRVMHILDVASGEGGMEDDGRRLNIYRLLLNELKQLQNVLPAPFVGITGAEDALSPDAEADRGLNASAYRRG